MKTFILILISLIGSVASAQESIRIAPISEWDNEDSTSYKIVLISADWCKICHSNKKIIRESEVIRNTTKEAFLFYEMKEEDQTPVTIGHEQFSYVQTGLSTGQHQFIDRFIIEPGFAEQATYPAFVFFNKKNELITSYIGFIDESAWVSTLGAILNHLEKPDSESSN